MLYLSLIIPNKVGKTKTYHDSQKIPLDCEERADKPTYHKREIENVSR